MWQTGRAEEASKLFRDALQRKPDFADAHYMLGTVLRQQGSLEEAVGHFRHTITYRPTSAEAHLSLGQTLQQLGRAGEAAASFAEAERLNRLKADAQASTFAVGVGLSRLKAGDIAGAIDRFREAIKLAPENPQAHYQLALALRRTGASAEARVHFEEARRLAPYLRPPDAR
jgi:Flp pilus assembly protein TadD